MTGPVPPAAIHAAAANQAVAHAIAQYEPEAVGALVASPSSALSVLLEAGRRALEAAAPHIAAAGRSETLIVEAQDYARAESERADRLATLARDILAVFGKTSDGQVQISKWEMILQQLEDAAGDLADPASDPAEDAYEAGRAAERERLRAEIPTGVIHFEGELSEAEVSELAAKFQAALSATEERIAAAVAAERQRWRAVLADHYPMGINCDPATKRDNPMCGCSRTHLGWHPSIGAARQAWIDHVAAVIRGEAAGGT